MPSHKHRDRSKKGGCGDSEATVTAVLVVLAIVLIIVVVLSNCRGGAQRHKKGGHCGAQANGFNAAALFDAAERAPAAPIGEARRDAFNVTTDGMVAEDDAPKRRSVHAELERLYSTADVDPLITGLLYGHADHVRNVYAQRTSHGDVHGLTEYSSAGGPGDVGVDIGPYGLEEYGGKQIGYDDGIPDAWAMPSTPIRWYGPHKRDYYGPEGPTPYSDGLYPLTEPDHDPLVS